MNASRIRNLISGAVAGLLVCATALSMGEGAVLAEDAAADLRAQLEELAGAYEFEVQGLQNIERSPAVEVEGGLTEQLETILNGYNFMIYGTDGAISKVLVSSRQSPRQEFPAIISINTVRKGRNHFLDATVVGRKSETRELQLMVDTGASTVVLPTSMIAELGFVESDLARRIMKTANGEVEGKMATLSSVRVGRAVARDVAVVFIEDSRLGGNSLLGMSFLGRYVTTIDDANNQLRLEPSK